MRPWTMTMTIPVQKPEEIFNVTDGSVTSLIGQTADLNQSISFNVQRFNTGTHMGGYL
jgi:hypothetical protein